MNKKKLSAAIADKKTFLCVGLDTDINRIPKYFLDYDQPLLEFNKMIIDATQDHCVAYKPNIAFYESLGSKGWDQLKATLDYIPEDIFTIADAKRGDIGNTSRMYAKTFFDHMNFDSVTVAPYMGIDSVTPFLEYEDKWVILLGLTSNTGSNDFQRIQDKNGTPLYKHVIKKSQEWASSERLMYVIGATHPDDIADIRAIAEDYFFLVPGIGAQGGDLKGVIHHGKNDDGGLLINSSRGIIYAGEKADDYSAAVTQAAQSLSKDMSELM